MASTSDVQSVRLRWDTPDLNCAFLCLFHPSEVSCTFLGVVTYLASYRRTDVSVRPFAPLEVNSYADIFEAAQHPQ